MWEYECEKIGARNIEHVREHLGAMGRSDWELVSCNLTSDNNMILLIWKRPKTETKKGPIAPLPRWPE